MRDARIAAGRGLLLLAASILTIARAGAQEAAADGEAEAEDIVVTADVELFRSTIATSATRLPLDIVETPQSITVLTEDALRLTGSRNLKDASGLVPGFVSKGTYGGFDNRFSARGFDVPIDRGVLINGVRSASNVDRDFLGVDRIEYLRGPTSITLGPINFGGAINIITRRPGAKLRGEVLAEAGSYELIRVQAEVEGSLEREDRVRGYFGIAFEDRGSFRAAEDFRKVPVRAALDMDITPDTNFQLDIAYDRGSGTPIGTFSRDYDNSRGGFLPDYVPFDWNPCEFLERCRTEYDNLNITGTIRHDFSERFYLRAIAGYNWTERQHRFVSYLGLGGPTGFGFTRQPGPYGFWYTYDDTDRFETVFLELGLGGKIEALGQEHDWLVLVEKRDRTYSEDYQLNDPSLFFVQYAGVVNPTAVPPSSGVRPVVDQPTFSWDRTIRREDNLAVTAQAILRPFDRLSLLLGVRWERENQREAGINNGGADGPFASSYDVNLRNRAEDVVFRGGATFNVFDRTFAYVSFSEGFIPTNVKNDSGMPIPSETATQWEGGIKGEFMGGRLGAGLALFRIDRDNVPATIGDGILGMPASRSQRHEGVELEMLGQLTQAINLIATYSYLDTRITRNAAAPATVGREIPNAPNHMASLFVQVAPPRLFGVTGLSFGGGFRYTGEVWDSESNLFRLPDYTLIDANIRWVVNERLQLQLIGRNLGNDRYFQSFGGSGFFGWTYGEPRTILGRVAYQF